MVLQLTESLDTDGVIPIEVQDVIAIIEGVGEDADKSMNFKITDEGLVIDLVDDDGEIIATNSFHINDIEELLY
jgi:hypothetical protein